MSCVRDFKKAGIGVEPMPLDLSRSMTINEEQLEVFHQMELNHNKGASVAFAGSHKDNLRPLLRDILQSPFTCV